MEVYKYRVVGENTVVRHEDEDYAAGEVIELPKHVAQELRHQIEPVDDAGAFDEPLDDDRKFLKSLSTFRDHEREQELNTRKEKLTRQLGIVNEELDKIQASRRPAPATEAPANAKAAKK